MSLFLNVAGALCLVLAVISFLVMYLRKTTWAGGRVVPSELQVEVVSRAALAPKQGVAVLRVGQRTLAVSYGEGGVRALGEVEAPRPAWGPQLVSGDEGSNGPAEQLDDVVVGSVGSEDEAPPTFSNALRTVLQRSILSVVLVAATTAFTATGLTAQDLPIDPTGAAGLGAAVAAQVDAAGAVGTTGGAGTAPQDLEPSVLRDLMQAAGVGLDDESDSLLPGPVGAVVFVGFLTLLPTLLLLMTSFTRILVVLNLLRQALGTQTAPPSHLLIALSLMLTGFVMSPTLEQVNDVALQPWVAGEIDEVQMLSAGAGPFREFMLSQVRERDLSVFMEIHGSTVASVDEIPLTVVTSAFVTSELRRAFQIGFAIFLPFVVIDVVVASVLMSMGMFMLPPVMVSLPFKLLLFVLVDGWALMMSGLVRSFIA